MTPFGMTFYARMCGWTLARAHARSGDPVAIAAYLGARRPASIRRSTDFPPATPTRTTTTTKRFVQAVKGGRIDAVQGV